MKSSGRIDRDGYLYILRKDHPNSGKQGYVAEHRLVMEEHIGRYLLKTEVVHHKDHNPRNNSIENLELCESAGKHIFLHHPDVMKRAINASIGRKPANYARKSHTCIYCSKVFMANPNRKRNFCSRICYGKSKISKMPTNTIGLELGRGWNKGMPLTWQRKGKDSPHFKHGKYSKYV